MVTFFKKIIPFLVVIVLSLPSIWPLFVSGYFPMHDDTHPTRVFEMAEAIKSGQFPVRWVSNLGYGFGYPIFNFYSPLPYYVGAFFALIGFSLITATKIMFGIGILVSGISMYALVEKLFGKRPAILASMLYMYAPYHAVQLYVRGAVGEYWAYAFLPYVFLGIVISKRNKYLGISLGSVGLASVILSHNITAFILAGFLTLCLFSEFIRKYFFKIKTNIGNTVAIIICGLLASAFFWLPAIVELSYTKVQSLASGSNDFRAHFVFLDQLWNSSWGYAGSAIGRSDGISFKIGKVHILILLIASMVLLYKKLRLKKEIYSLSYLGFFGIFISVFFMLPASQVIWELIPGMGYIQYPWRFLVFVLFFLCFSVGSLFQINSRFNTSLIGILLAVTIFANVKYFQPQYIRQVKPAEYVLSEEMRWKISKISDEYLPKNFPIPQTYIQIAQSPFSYGDAIIVESSEIKNHHIHAVLSVQEKAEFIFSLAFFPGWKFIVDNEQVQPSIRDGLPVLILDSGKHIVAAYFSDTWPRIVGNILSFIGIVLIGTFLVKNYEKK